MFIIYCYCFLVPIYVMEITLISSALVMNRMSMVSNRHMYSSFLSWIWDVDTSEEKVVSLDDK
jgi:hypothetical protein